MNELGRIDIFLEVAREGSFSKAARRLGISAPAVTKQVQALEEELGAKLLHRSTRHVALSEEGERYFQRAQVAIDELKAAAQELHDARAQPKGSLRINAPMSFAHLHLLPLFTGFAKRYPEIDMHLALEDRKIDVLADGFDVVIRVGAVVDSGLGYRRLASCPLYVVASPEYVAQHGTPKKLAELESHRVIGYTQGEGVAEWKMKSPAGRIETFRSGGVLTANTAEMMLQAALDGIGIALLPIFTVSEYLAAGKLVTLLDAYESYPPREIAALMPPNRYRSRKVQLFLDWLAQGCKALPW